MSLAESSHLRVTRKIRKRPMKVDHVPKGAYERTPAEQRLPQLFLQEPPEFQLQPRRPGPRPGHWSCLY